MTKRFVSIWFPHLAADWFTLRKPELKSLPFVLTAPVHGRKIVKACNPEALQIGMYPGMVLADAKAIYPGLQNFDDKPDLVPQLLQRLAEWCIRFTPASAPDPLEGILLDATGCSPLWGGDEKYITDILKRLSARGYTARAAMADTIGAAWALARFSKISVVPKEGQKEALLSLPSQALRLDPETVDRLHKLGLSRIKDLVAIPHKALRRRFGIPLIQRIGQALGMEDEYIQPVYPPEPFRERLPCIETIHHRPGIEIALRTLLGQLCARLQKEGKGLRQAFFRCYRTDGKTSGIQISTHRPSHHPGHLFHLFELQLSTIDPGLGIELFLLEATATEDHLPGQESFWKEAGGTEDPRLSEWMDRVSSRIGADVLHRYLPQEHWWPERSFKKAASLTEQPRIEWRVDKPRPVRLFSPPEPIEVMAPIPDYPPMLFRYRDKRHKITKADGPERIEQEWWIQEGDHRDYYAVEDEEGCRYWLFRSGHYDDKGKAKWFLHGVFA
jgi:protein ImuB